MRSFLRQPGFSVTAILALALGIGANTAVFSVVRGVLLKPLPFPDPGALVLVHDTYPAVPSASVSFPKLLALKERTATLEALGGYAHIGVTLTGAGEPEQVTGVRVSADFFRALAVQPLLGRRFTEEEDQPSGPKAIILSQSLWRRRFGSDPGAVGQTIQVDGITRTIVGVMPQDSQYPSASQFWIPLALPRTASGGNNFLRLLGRMRPGATVAQVQADLGGVSAEFNRQNGLARDVRVWPLHESLVTANRRTLLVLQGAVAFVLLVACANVANLLLARSVSRQRELAIRAAIGAGRARLVRQLMTESVMLAAAGGAAGVLFGGWLLRLFLALAPSNFPRLQAVSLDTGVLAFTLVVSTLTGIAFGLAPAGQGFRTRPNDSLRETGARGGAGRSRGASRILVVAEIALALVLVIGAGLMVKSLLRLENERPGFTADGVLTFSINLPQAKYPESAPRDFYVRLLDEIRSVPGVQAAAAINYAPMTTFGFNGPFSVKGRPPFERGKAPATEFRFVSPGYFATMRIPVLRGAEFTAVHNETHRPVVIINETMARQYLGGMDPIGAQMELGVDLRPTVREVVGVVADVRDATLDRKPVPETFIPHAQAPLNAMAIVVRTTGEMTIEQVLPPVRQRLAGIDPDVPMIRPQALSTAIAATTGSTRMTSTLTSVFGLVAALLASVGIYSLIAYSVAQRSREIGVRVALGANRRAVMRLVLGEGLTLAVIGIAAGLAGSFLLTRALETMLYEVSPTDPVVLGATCAGVLLVSMLASLVPALRAVRIDPMVALRAE